jgi:uncharacterized protein
MTLHITNRDARRLWLATQGLSGQAWSGQRPPADGVGGFRKDATDLAAPVRRLGLVQLDSIQVISRAHHHILWSRNPSWREKHLHRMLAKERSVFEHFTHDASLLPIEIYPYWRRRFRQLEAKVQTWEWHRGMLDEKGRNWIKDRIREEGPLSTHAFDTKVEGPREMWRRPPHKLALDFMWYSGELATSHREGFIKFYDLAERVIPARYREDERSEDEQVRWLCERALHHLGFATTGEIKAFWNAVSPAEATAWAAHRKSPVRPVEIASHDGAVRRALGAADIDQRLSHAPEPSSRLRILSPFDPAVRDRKRLLALFGFDYTIEIFVPAAKRKWGYYVYPLLEGDRFVGRAEIRANREAGTLTLSRLWAEPGARWTPPRWRRLEAELNRLARLCDASSVRIETRDAQ